MNASRLLFVLAYALLSAGFAGRARAEAPAPAEAKPPLDFFAAGGHLTVTPSDAAKKQVTISRGENGAAGLTVTIQPGKAGYPGIEIKPAGAESWNLSAYGHVQARVVNTGATPMDLSLRVDNDGDWHANPWSAEAIHLQPGAAGDISVTFGYSFGHKRSFALNPAAVVQILFYTLKSDAAQSFRVESLAAAGSPSERPPVDPASIHIKPPGGVLLGPSVKLDPAKQIVATGGANASIAGAADASALRVEFPSGAVAGSAALKPALGRWDLSDFTEVRIALKNEGTTPVTPTIKLTSNAGPTSVVAASAPLAPGARGEIVVPFAASVPFVGTKVTKPGHHGGVKGTGTQFTSDAVASVVVAAAHEGPATLLLESITAAAPPAVVPDWLGKRPPVPGEWVKTLDDNFKAPAIDSSVWNIYGPNYWDTKTHWAKDNLILSPAGGATFHFEKKPGHQNDNPKERTTPYTCGFLETYGKWVQRYGYFETRVKLPTAPGLWPTFWLMPDRGANSGPHQDRQDTGNGGMEFDIMEHLDRWGPYRYNIALHWDGYGKEHKAMESACNYVQADKDGYITAGLLWTPGSAIFYGNGKELWRWEDPRICNVPAGIIIEMTTGGWDNNPVDDAKLPADYVIDYVRVWQRKDLASAVDGTQPQAKAEAK